MKAARDRPSRAQASAGRTSSMQPPADAVLPRSANAVSMATGLAKDPLAATPDRVHDGEDHPDDEQDPRDV